MLKSFLKLKWWHKDFCVNENSALASDEQNLKDNCNTARYLQLQIFICKVRTRVWSPNVFPPRCGDSLRLWWSSAIVNVPPRSQGNLEDWESTLSTFIEHPREQWKRRFSKIHEPREPAITYLWAKCLIICSLCSLCAVKTVNTCVLSRHEIGEHKFPSKSFSAIFDA